MIHRITLVALRYFTRAENENDSILDAILSERNANPAFA